MFYFSETPNMYLYNNKLKTSFDITEVSGNVPEILMILAALFLKEGTVILDEPGLPLNPELRNMLRRAILSHNSEGSIIVITHAPELLEENSLEYTYRCFIDQNSTQALCLADANKLVAQSLETQFKPLLFAQNVLFVEGKTDTRLLELFYWLIDNDKEVQTILPEYKAISRWSVINLGGSSKSKIFIDLARHFHINWKVLLDGDMFDHSSSSKSLVSDLLQVKFFCSCISCVRNGFPLYGMT